MTQNNMEVVAHLLQVPDGKPFATSNEYLVKIAKSDGWKVEPLVTLTSSQAEIERLTKERDAALRGLDQEGENHWEQRDRTAAAEKERDALRDDGWQPITTAPKDGSSIDLWHREFGRHPDHYWGFPTHECDESGSHCDSDRHRSDAGWVDSTFDEFSFEPDSFTHWRKPPAPPLTPTAGAKE